MIQLKGFRNLARHGYDLVLKPDRLADLARIAENISAEQRGARSLARQ